jgi:hypothetical protein
MFYCTGCGKMEDSDFVGYEVDDKNEEYCEETFPQEETE